MSRKIGHRFSAKGQALEKAPAGAMSRKGGQRDDSLIERFLDMLAAERGASDNTLAAYGKDLADYSEHLGKAKRAIASATTDNIQIYLASLTKRGFAAASLARRLSAVRQLHRFLYAEG